MIGGDCANIEHICSPQVIESTKEFEKALKEMQFLKQDKTALLKYACNVNFHFANKKCQDLIKAARKLMTSEIHNTVKVTGDASHSFSVWKTIPKYFLIVLQSCVYLES